jgi:kinetochore protein Nuf2
MDTTRETVAPAMKAAAEDLCQSSGNEAERLYTADVRDLMGFFVTLRRLLVECNIEDFGFNDLYRPTYQRLAKILSYIINFVRFRESQTGVIDKHFEEGERTKLRVQQLYAEKESMEQRLIKLRASAKETEKKNAEKETHYESLKTQLRELVRAKDTLRLETESLESQKENLISTFESRAVALETVRDEGTKLKPYTLQKPEALEASLRDLNTRLAEDRGLLENLDKRARALQTSSDSFSAAAQDVQTCIRLLSDLSSDLQKEDDEAAKAAKHREALSDRVASVEDVERQERLLQKQLESINARTEKLRRGAEEKAEQARQRMDALQEVHRNLVKERGEKAREVERRRVRIEQTEKKVSYIFYNDKCGCECQC